MANPTAPLSAIANPYQAYNDLINQQVSTLQAQPQSSALDPLTMLAVAQGFLSPTRTGGFGESLGNAAGQAIGPLSRARAADSDRMDKIAKLRETQVKLALEKKRIDDLNARAAAGYGGDPILDYSRIMNGLKTQYDLAGDPNAIDLDASTPEGKAEKERRIQERQRIKGMIDTMTDRYVGGISRGAGASRQDGDGTEPRRPAASQQPGPGGAAPAQAGRAGRVASDLDLQNARDAYNRGAPIDAILKRFKDNGITGITSEDITGK